MLLKPCHHFITLLIAQPLEVNKILPCHHHTTIKINVFKILHVRSLFAFSMIILNEFKHAFNSYKII